MDDFMAVWVWVWLRSNASDQLRDCQWFDQTLWGRKCVGLVNFRATGRLNWMQVLSGTPTLLTCRLKGGLALRKSLVPWLFCFPVHSYGAALGGPCHLQLFLLAWGGHTASLWTALEKIQLRKAKRSRCIDKISFFRNQADGKTPETHQGRDQKMSAKVFRYQQINTCLKHRAWPLRKAPPNDSFDAMHIPLPEVRPLVSADSDRGRRRLEILEGNNRFRLLTDYAVCFHTDLRAFVWCAGWIFPCWSCLWHDSMLTSGIFTEPL